MKKIMYSLCAVTLAVMSGCQDEVVENPVVPAQTGEEITFGSSLENPESRTVYDDPVLDGDGNPLYYPVYWEADGSDQIAIYCPQASQGKLVKYTVTPQDGKPSHSSAVTKANDEEAGLQWGEGEGVDGTHHFYAFYPGSAVTGTEDGKIKGNIPATQTVVRWDKPQNEQGGITYTGVANTDYAFMWAYGKHDKTDGGDVSLLFHPWVTILDIEVQGPEEGTMKVSNINIRAIEGSETVLTGEFVCDMTPVENGGEGAQPSYQPLESGPAVRNNISITCWDPAEDDFIELGPTDKIVVRAYLLPIDEGIPDARNLQIRVQPMNGAVLTRTLGYSGTTGGVQPHKVNKVILPKLRSQGTNYWMTSVDENVYLSELSIPGSKFSYLYGTNAGDNAAYQGNDIATQFKDGVRAFIVQVGADATYEAEYHRSGWFDGYYTYQYTNATMPIFCGGGATLSSAIGEIAGALNLADQEKPGHHECAVVMLTYSGNAAVNVQYTGDKNESQNGEAGGIDITGGAEKVWMDAIANVLKYLGDNPSNRIFTEEITANTTLADVAGKIIFKVNTNSDAQADYIAADETVPALFSRWNEAKNKVPLRWGTLNSASSRPALQWLYQEATHVGDNTEITPANKIAYIEDVFNESVTEYQENEAHDTWFMNDCGGTFHEEVSGANGYDGKYGNGDTNDEATIALSRWINPQVTQFLQERGNNAATGLVFFNFADKQEGSGQTYGTDNLIQTIIDNNFKFNLRMKGGTSSNAMSVQSASSYASGGNVWE